MKLVYLQLRLFLYPTMGVASSQVNVEGEVLLRLTDSKDQTLAYPKATGAIWSPRDKVNGFVNTLEVELEVLQVELEDEALPLPLLGGFRMGDKIC
ncbi:unnamed protein product [Sphenostylis stenocarpa]|uniref:Uncharacterized protein n=1 Tax=Sphenostylis stenocarpa TaxID=92480 RepID=A0AA86T469_9FABA|nr:unnamed protein product [Sphenostylis stenocarpa]